MKATVSIRGLKSFLSEHKPDCFLYCSCNQDWYDDLEAYEVSMSFPSIYIFDRSDRVCLKSLQDTVVFNRVCYAEIDTGATVLGTTIKLFCKKLAGAGCVPYTIIAS